MNLRLVTLKNISSAAQVTLGLSFLHPFHHWAGYFLQQQLKIVIDQCLLYTNTTHYYTLFNFGEGTHVK